jgi:O-antigen ligase
VSERGIEIGQDAKLAVLAFVPLLSIPQLAETRELPRWILIQLAAFVALAIQIRRGERSVRPIWSWAALAFGVEILVASALAESPLRSIYGPYEGHFGMLASWTGIALAAGAPRIERLPRWIATLVGIGIIETIVLVVQRASDAPPLGTLGHVLFFSAFLTLSIVAAAGWALDAEDRRVRIGLAIATFAMGAALTIAGRRTSLVALFLALLFLTIASKKRRRLAPIGAAVVLATVLFGGFVPNPLQPYQPLARWGEVVHARTSAGDHVHQRLDYYRVALSAARERPITGWGFGTFRDRYASQKASDLMPEEGNVHSVWIELLLSTGALGLLAFMVLVGASIVAARERIRSEADAPWAGRLLACAGIAIAHLAYLSVNFDQAALAGWAWAMTGFLVTRRPEAVRARPGLRWAASAGFLAIGLFGAQRIVADAAAAECVSRGIQGRLDESACDLAVRMSPYECTYRIQMASVTTNYAREKAIAWLRPCLRLEPTNARLHHELGMILSKRGTPAEAAEGTRELIRASVLAPFSASYHRDAQVDSSSTFGQP